MGLNNVEKDGERKRVNNIITILDDNLFGAIWQPEENKNDKTWNDLLKNCVICFVFYLEYRF